MITAVDSCVLIDLLINDLNFAERSQSALRQARQDGQVIISDLVVSEITPIIGNDLDAFLKDLSIEFCSTSFEASIAAGKAFTSYLKRGGKRGRVVADFLIAAHAIDHNARLLTRDEGFLRKDFRPLKVWYPSEVSG